MSLRTRGAVYQLAPDGGDDAPAGRLQLLQAQPPYDRLATGDATGPHAPGTVLVLPVDGDVAHGRIVATTERLLRAAPAAAVAAMVDGSNPASAAQARAACTLAGLPLVPAVRDRPDAHVLRDALTHPPPAVRGLEHWLRVVVNADVRLADLIVRISDDAVRTTHGTAACLAAPPCSSMTARGMGALIGLSERGLREACTAAGLPRPRQLRTWARLFACTLRLQSDTCSTLTRLALLLGYPDLAALDRLYREELDVKPSWVRERLGWQWVAHLWFKRKRRP
jgi:AraC-like DNA-binding protein